jgi:SAM-dependent methyltransferase
MQRNQNGWNRTWSSELITALMKAQVQDLSPQHYPGSALQIQSALEDYVVTSIPVTHLRKPIPRILVAGSISPWVEALVLRVCNGSKKVYTADWQPIEMEDERTEFVSMTALQEHKETFDVIISFSSIEHDGLGRYGDPIDPEGDFKGVAELRRLLKPDGLFLLGLPYAQNEGKPGSPGPRIEGNLHRIYGAERLARLTRGFDLMERIDPVTALAHRFKNIKSDFRISIRKDAAMFQPLFVLRKSSQR